MYITVPDFLSSSQRGCVFKLVPKACPMLEHITSNTIFCFPLIST